MRNLKFFCYCSEGREIKEKVVKMLAKMSRMELKACHLTMCISVPNNTPIAKKRKGETKCVK